MNNILRVYNGDTLVVWILSFKYSMLNKYFHLESQEERRRRRRRLRVFTAELLSVASSRIKRGVTVKCHIKSIKFQFKVWRRLHEIRKAIEMSVEFGWLAGSSHPYYNTSSLALLLTSYCKKQNDIQILYSYLSAHIRSTHVFEVTLWDSLVTIFLVLQGL